MATTSLFSYKPYLCVSETHIILLLLFVIICTVIHVRYVVLAGIFRTVLRTVLSLIVLILSHNMYPFRNFICNSMDKNSNFKRQKNKNYEVMVKYATKICYNTESKACCTIR